MGNNTNKGKYILPDTIDSKVIYTIKNKSFYSNQRLF